MPTSRSSSEWQPQVPVQHMMMMVFVESQSPLLPCVPFLTSRLEMCWSA